MKQRCPVERAERRPEPSGRPARAIATAAPTYRIAMVAACPFPARRGTPLRVQRLAEALHARGHEVELITYHIGDRAALPFPVHRIFGRSVRRSLAAGPSVGKLLLFDPALARRLRAVLAGKRFDLIHAHHYEGLIVGLLARRRYRLPLVYDAHTMLASELPSYGPGVARPVLEALGRWADGALPRRADHVVAVTRDIRERLVGVHGLAPDRVTVAMNGVEVAAFAVAEPPPEETAGRLIYTGTLAPYQDIELLLEAFARALRLRPWLRLEVAAGSPFDGYERRARELGIRAAIDVVPDDFARLPGRLAAAAVAVLPRTRCDGIPQKLLNYMAAAKAVVASAGSAKVIEHERTGLVVANGDAEAFARAIVRLVDDPALGVRLGRSARAYVQRHCTWETTARSCEGVYARLRPIPVADPATAGVAASVAEGNRVL